MSAPARQDHLASGIALYVSAFFCFILMDAVSKLLVQTYSVTQLVWVRHVVHCLVMIVLFGPIIGRAMLRTRSPRLQLARALLMLVMTYAMMVALTLMPLADTTAIVFMAPLAVVALSRWVLHEPVDGGRWAAVAVGFVGVLFILRPGAGQGMALGAVLLALLMVCCNATFQIVTRKLSTTDSAFATNFLTSFACTLASGIPAPIGWVTPDLRDGLLMASLGVLGALGHFVFIKAFERAQASVLAPFMYSGLVWAILFGWAMFGDLPDALEALGMALIVASGVYVARRGSSARR